MISMYVCSTGAFKHAHTLTSVSQDAVILRLPKIFISQTHVVPDFSTKPRQLVPLQIEQYGTSAVISDQTLAEVSVHFQELSLAAQAMEDAAGEPCKVTVPQNPQPQGGTL